MEERHKIELSTSNYLSIYKKLKLLTYYICKKIERATKKKGKDIFKSHEGNNHSYVPSPHSKVQSHIASLWRENHNKFKMADEMEVSVNVQEIPRLSIQWDWKDAFR